MSWENIQAEDFGWVGKLTIVQDGVAVDISSYTTRQFIFTDPTGTITTKTATFDTDGVDGVLKYTILDNEVNTAGYWYVQARIIKSGVELTSDPLRFFVSERLD